MTDLLHRIRWTNLARVVALLLLALLALAWPLLKGGDDDLPRALTEPLAAEPDPGSSGGAPADETSASGDEAVVRVAPEDPDARVMARRAALRKAAKRRELKDAAAERAEARRRTAARQRSGGPPTGGAIPVRGGAVRGLAAPGLPSPEFRP